jgi:hypothetical protein
MLMCVLCTSNEHVASFPFKALHTFDKLEYEILWALRLALWKSAKVQAGEFLAVVSALKSEHESLDPVHHPENHLVRQ